MEQAAAVGSQKWRLNNLYNIVDEQGNTVLFKMRPAQELFFDNLWYFNIILKARQLGFTTFIDLIALDMAIFKPNFTAVIIAETKEKAEDIFSSKVVFPYNNLPKELKDWNPVKSCTSDGEIRFANNSCIKVMVSARSGTCQFLHISEYGPVCAKSPAKAKEIKTGCLPAVHEGGFCFIESTAMGNSGHFFDFVQEAEKDLLSGRTLSKKDFRLHFFPWHQNPEYRLQGFPDFVFEKRLIEYFERLEAEHKIILTQEQKVWYATEERKQHDDMWAEYPSFVSEAFQVAQDGSYYGKWFRRIYQENRITRVPHDPALPVYTGWDLGMSDQTTIWFLQFFGKEVRVIDYYENSGEGLGHYIGVLKSKPYRYARHFAPHDIAVRELGSGVSRLDTARKLGCQFDVIPTNRDVMAGIDAVREMLDYCYFDRENTSDGVKCLENYKKEWDDKNGHYKNYPCHDWSSHGSDGFRTIAVAWEMGLCLPPERSRSNFSVTGGLKRI